MRIKSFFYFLFLFYSLISCSSLTRGKKEIFRNSIFQQKESHNNFISSFSPLSFPSSPSLDIKKPSPPLHLKLDSLNKNLYLKSQSEFHYILAESWSLEEDSQRAIEEFNLALVYDQKSQHLRLRLSVEYFKEGLWFRGIEEIQKVLSQNPESSEARFLLANVYSSLKFYSKALKQYKLLEKKYPRNEKVPLALAALFLDQEQYDLAEKELLKGLNLAKGLEKNEFYFHLAQLYFFQSNRTKEKIKNSQSQIKANQYKEKGKAQLKKSLLLNPKHIPSLLLMVEFLEEEKNLNQAIKTLLLFENQFEPTIETSKKLSEIYMIKKEHKKALKHFKQLEDLDPYNLNYKLQTALIQLELKKYFKALDRFHFILRKENSDRVCFYLGMTYAKLHQFDKAFFYFSKIPKISSYHTFSVIERAHLHQLLGNQKKTKEILKSTLAENKNLNPNFFLFYASVLKKEGHLKKALKILKQASLSFPKNTDLIFFSGLIYDKLGKVNQALESMQKVLLLDDTHLDAMNYVAYTYALKNMNLITAESLALKVLKESPEDGHYLDTMGMVLYKRGRIKEAIIYLEKAFKLEPNESVIAEHLAEVYFQYRLIKKSYFMYKKAFELEKNQKKKKEIAFKIKSIEALKKSLPQHAEASLKKL